MIEKKDYFPKVREAREALLAEAEWLIEVKKRIINEALDTGDLALANEASDWLLAHMPSHEGVTVVETSVDKQKGEAGPKGPTINIGLALGGLTHQQSLPIEIHPLVIEAEKVEDE